MSTSTRPSGARAVLRAPHVLPVLLAAQIGRIPQAAAPLALLPLLSMPGPLGMAPLAALCGLALPPVLTVTFLTADRLAPAGTVVEAFAWVATAFVIGSALGSAATGPLAENALRLGFAFAPVAGLVAAVLMTFAAREPE